MGNLYEVADRVYNAYTLKLKFILTLYQQLVTDPDVVHDTHFPLML